MSRLKFMEHPLRSGRTGAVACVAVAAALALGGCAAPMAWGPSEYSAGRARVALPSLEWEDLGTASELLPLQAGVGHVPLQDRALALRDGQRAVVAVLLVQSLRSNSAQKPTLWTGECPPQRGVWVEDAAAGSPLRVDCLRFKRWASSEGWMAKNHPDIAGWMQRNQAEPARPYAHLNYRFAADGGAFVEVNAMVDHRLLRPAVRTGVDFVQSGQAADRWSRAVAESARLSAGLVDGFFAIPAFPQPVPD